MVTFGMIVICLAFIIFVGAMLFLVFKTAA